MSSTLEALSPLWRDAAALRSREAIGADITPTDSSQACPLRLHEQEPHHPFSHSSRATIPAREAAKLFGSHFGPGEKARACARVVSFVCVCAHQETHTHKKTYEERYDEMNASSRHRSDFLKPSIGLNHYLFSSLGCCDQLIRILLSCRRPCRLLSLPL